MAHSIPQSVLLRWIQNTLELQGKNESTKIESMADLVDGVVLAKLAQALIPEQTLKVSLKKSNQKMVILGRLQTVLQFIADTGIRVTCSPSDIYDQNESLVFGLIWVLILRFQIKCKSDVIEWVLNMVNIHARSRKIETEYKMKSFQDGLGFCCLLNAIKLGTVDIDSLSTAPERIAKAFEAGQEIGIPALLEEDQTFDEKSLLLYFSYYYHKFHNQEPEPEPEPEPVPDPQIEILKARVAELEEENENLAKSIVEKDLEVERVNALMLDKVMKAEGDLAELQESQEELEKELEDTKKENEIVEKKVTELTLKMPFFLKKEQSSTPPPEGEVTLVFTDVQSSTLQWEHRPDAMAASLAIHNQMMRDLIQKHGGYEVKTEGDAFMIAFSSATSAVKWCLETQQELLKQDWPEKIYEGEDSAIEEVDGQEIYRGLRVRMGVHTGEPKAERDPVTGRMDYFGPMVNRSARVEGTAHGGQIVLSGECFEAIQESVANKEIEEFETIDMGEHTLKGLQTDTHLHQILPISLVKRKFPEYGAKPVGEEESEGDGDIMAEMEQLAKENEQLKAKMTDLESEAEEAAERTEVLSKLLEEIQKDLPPSLGKELLSATKDINKLIKSHSGITVAIAQAREESKKMLVGFEKNKRKLRKSERKVRQLQQSIEERDEAIAKLHEEIRIKDHKLEKTASSTIRRFLRFSSPDIKANGKAEEEEEGEEHNHIAPTRSRTASISTPKKRRSRPMSMRHSKAKLKL